MLDPLEPRAKRRLVAVCRRHAVGALYSGRCGCRHAAGRQARDYGDAGGLKHGPAAHLGSIVVLADHFVSLILWLAAMESSLPLDPSLTGSLKRPQEAARRD
jgi:hypothetical protein